MLIRKLPFPVTVTTRVDQVCSKPRVSEGICCCKVSVWFWDIAVWPPVAATGR